MTASGIIDGVVTDTALKRLEGAEIAIVRTSIHVTTLASGRFRITSVPSGHYIVIVRKLGYHPVSAVVEVPDGDTLRLSYTLEPMAQSLDTARVTERWLSPGLAEFEQRRKFGEGQFLTQEQVESFHATMSSSLFKRVRGFAVVPGRGSSEYLTSLRGTNTINGKPCTTQVWLDGVLLPSPTNLNDLPTPNEIAGIEVYTGPATAPVQYASRGTQCGIALVWTKHGG